MFDFQGFVGAHFNFCWPLKYFANEGIFIKIQSYINLSFVFVVPKIQYNIFIIYIFYIFLKRALFVADFGKTSNKNVKTVN